MTPILNIEDLSIRFNTAQGTVYAVNNVSLTLNKGEVLGIVGESGSGKSQLMLSIICLLAENADVEGEVVYNDKDILQQSSHVINDIRNNNKSQ